MTWAAKGADPTIADVRFADTTLIYLAVGGTPVDLAFAYTLSAQAKARVDREVYLPKHKPSDRTAKAVIIPGMLANEHWKAGLAALPCSKTRAFG